jgi:hypothetical protein
MHEMIPNPVLPGLGFSDVLITAFSWTPAGEAAPAFEFLGGAAQLRLVPYARFH